METQVKAFYRTPQGVKFVTIFGYATKGVPSLEINGAGKLSKNIKEKIIYLTRIRKLSVPLRRFVVCVDLNELKDQHVHSLKWLEFPLLLVYWYLCGLIPISKLDDCLCSGWLKTNGEIFHMQTPENLRSLMNQEFESGEKENLKLVGIEGAQMDDFYSIDTNLLLEHIPELKFKLDFFSDHTT